jgi:hypothetical protein
VQPFLFNVTPAQRDEHPEGCGPPIVKTLIFAGQKSRKLHGSLDFQDCFLKSVLERDFYFNNKEQF